MSHVLKLVITFKKRVIDASLVKEKAKVFFNEYHQFDNVFNISIAEAKNLDIDSVYTEDVYEIDVILQYSIQQNIGDLFSKIVKGWCDPGKNPLSFSWLRINNCSCLENKGKLCHPDEKVKEIAFGTIPDMQHYMQHYHFESNSNQEEMMITFLHSQRKFLVYTCFKHSTKCQEDYEHNKFQIFYQSISRVLVNYVPNKDVVQIFFYLQHVPLLYVSRKSRHRGDNSDESVLLCDQEYQEKRWDRALDFGCQCKKSLCAVKEIGRYPVFKIVILKKKKTSDIIERLMQRCSSSTLFHFAGLETIHPKINLRDFEKFPFNEAALKLYSTESIVDVKFKCQFAWKVVLGRSLEIRDQIILKCQHEKSLQHWDNLKHTLSTFFIKDVDCLIQSLYDISEMINKNILFSFEDALKEFYNYHHKYKIPEDIPDGMCLVRRIVISPAKIVCLPPSEHFDNRVIRKYGAENLLRLSIQDDDFSKLTFAVQYHSRKREFMTRVVKCILSDGITIGPRKYDMLAASNSQLREHGIWMYAKDHKENTADSIRRWMGDFSHIKNVPKYMARMGQCFSTSDESVQIELKDEEVIELPDIKTKDERYTFTDGVGLISKDLADKVRYKYAERNNMEQIYIKHIYDPSAFQIRFKGCKGMVAESRIPEMSEGRKIAIRPSMNKFPCNSSSVLEVVKISAPRPVYLNRPLITILENLGVNESAFMELQKKMVFDLTDSLIYEKKAKKMLENNTSLEFPFKKLYNAGISLSQEPFFRQLLLSVYKSLIGKLKCKTRIAISPKCGRNMMGIIDESGTLRYGQIFAQYSQQVSNFKSKTKILEGIVVVTKNPCMHPGDVRKFNAVDVPALHHIKDCIVFPAKGKRPHPDEMAGSDCDGDEYVLIWDPRLIFSQDNYPAMDYPPNEEQILNRPIQVEDMINFICTYIENDNIGIMANAHLAWADKLDEGIFSKVCMEIARKYPLALDFAKSGTTCSLHGSERPKLYPDFMEKGCRNNSYKSTKSLGLLYRVIRSLEASVSNINIDVSVTPDPQLDIPDWEEFEELALQRRNQYSKRLNSILKKHGLQSESEAFTGYAEKVNEYNSNKYDRENIVSLAKKYFMDTMKRYYITFLNDCAEQSALKSVPEQEIKNKMASAWYMVTYKNHETTSILSFPWVVSEILCDIKSKYGKTEGRGRISKSIFIDDCNNVLQLLSLSLNFDEEIENCKCVSILSNILMDWVRKSSFILTRSADNIFCSDCFERIVNTFREAVIMCCSNESGNCTCTKACSPMKLILECFKYYASGVNSNLGDCGTKLNTGAVCEGFRDINLQSLALKTHAALAITGNLQFLGVMNDDFFAPADDCNEEGDPIRVPVTKELEEILMGNMHKVCKVLKELTGVKEINIDGDKKDNYILVQCIGKPFQRWNLEELIMDSKCPSIIKSKIT